MKPKCPNPECRRSEFEFVKQPVKGTEFLYAFICCASCGTTLGVVEDVNSASLIVKLAQALRVKL
jgi:hypothetical protein